MTRPPTATLSIVGRNRPRESPWMASTANSASRKPDDAAEQRQRHALGEELAHQAAAGDPEGQPDADLLLPRRRLDQQQAAQVGAHHQHQERGDDRQQQQERPVRASSRCPARCRARDRARARAAAGPAATPSASRAASGPSPPARARGLTPGARRPKNQNSQAGLRRQQALRQPRAEEERGGLHRHPDVDLLGVQRAVEPLRRDAGDDEGAAVEVERAADHLPAGAEGRRQRPSPRTASGCVSRAPFAGGEQPTQRALEAEDREVVVGHQLAVHAQRLAVPRQVEGQRGVGHQVGEGAARLAGSAGTSSS